MLGAMLVGLGAVAACGGSMSMSTDGGPAGMCSANVPPGEACNTLTNVGWTYTLTSQTYYGLTGCPSEPVSSTIEIAGGCIQSVSGSPLPATASQTYTVAGAMITANPTCLHVGVDAGGFTVDAPGKTFTATPTTFTVFTKNSGTSSPNPDRAEAYAKR